jgi:hypothetical protein
MNTKQSRSASHSPGRIFHFQFSILLQREVMSRSPGELKMENESRIIRADSCSLVAEFS